MVRLAEMVKTAAGPTIDVACDVHTRLDVTSAIRLAKDLEQFHLMWLEEPVPPENVDAMREVKRATTTPICAGENLYLRHGFRELIEKQAVDIIMPDIPKCGGLSECRKIANLAEIYYMPFAPHNVSRRRSARWPRRTSARRCRIFSCSSFTGCTATTGRRSPTAATSSRTAGSRSATGPASASISTRRWRGHHQYPGTTWFE